MSRQRNSGSSAVQIDDLHRDLDRVKADRDRYRNALQEVVRISSVPGEMHDHQLINATMVARRALGIDLRERA